MAFREGGEDEGVGGAVDLGQAALVHHAGKLHRDALLPRLRLERAL